MDCRGCRPLFQVLCRRSFLWIAGVVGHCITSFAAVVFYGLQGLPATVSSPLPPYFSMDCRGCRPLFQVLCRSSFLRIAGVAGHCIRSFAAVVSYELHWLPATVLCRRSFLWIVGLAGHCIRSFAAVVFYGLQGLPATVLCRRSFPRIVGLAGHCIRSFAVVVFYGLQGLPATVSGPLSS